MVIRLWIRVFAKTQLLFAFLPLRTTLIIHRVRRSCDGKGRYLTGTKPNLSRYLLLSSPPLRRGLLRCVLDVLIGLRLACDDFRHFLVDGRNGVGCFPMPFRYGFAHKARSSACFSEVCPLVSAGRAQIRSQVFNPPVLHWTLVATCFSLLPMGPLGRC